jgi:hypothetical protein
MTTDGSQNRQDLLFKLETPCGGRLAVAQHRAGSGIVVPQPAGVSREKHRELERILSADACGCGSGRAVDSTWQWPPVPTCCVDVMRRTRRRRRRQPWSCDRGGQAASGRFGHRQWQTCRSRRPSAQQRWFPQPRPRTSLRRRSESTRGRTPARVDRKPCPGQCCVVMCLGRVHRPVLGVERMDAGTHAAAVAFVE